MTNQYRTQWFALAFLAISACGGGGGSDGFTPPADIPDTGTTPDPTPVANTGIFIDSAVGGINYRTETLSGVTSDLGEYSYEDGETVIFSIGDIDFPAAEAGPVVTLLDLLDTDNISDLSVTNMARLLQSLDLDGDPSNGITISDAAHESAAGLSLDFSSPEFADDVMNLVANSGSVTTELIDAASALAHLEESLAEAGLLPGNLLGSWYDDSGNKTVITFLDDSRYVVTQDIDEVEEPLCTDGVEFGIYNWDRDSGEFSLTSTVDTSGDCGLTSEAEETFEATVFVVADILTLSIEDEDIVIARLESDDNPLIGSWYGGGDNVSVVSFISDTEYAVAQNIDELGEPMCSDGVELGEYSIDAESGILDVSNNIDTTGDCGLTSVQGGSYGAEVDVADDGITLTDEEGTFTLPRVGSLPTHAWSGDGLSDTATRCTNIEFDSVGDAGDFQLNADGDNSFVSLGRDDGWEGSGEYSVYIFIGTTVELSSGYEGDGTLSITVIDDPQSESPAYVGTWVSADEAWAGEFNGVRENGTAFACNI